MKNLVVGAGVSGATIANLIASRLDEHVTVIDSKNHVAGNCYDYRDNNGIMVHKYGSHIFHTGSEKVWRFIQGFSDFNTYMHKVYGYLDGIVTHIPFNFNTLYDVFPESLARRIEQKLLDRFEYNSKVPILEFQKQDDSDLKFLADYVYKKIFLEYTRKQWGKAPSEVDGSVTARVPVYLSKDDRYFQDKYQGIPLSGYTSTVSKMLAHKNIKLKLGTLFKESDCGEFDRIFYTGSIDEFFNYKFGTMPYRSLRFKFETHKQNYYQQSACINYPCNYDFTRIHEYKYYLNDQSSSTVIAKEYPQEFELGKNERYYPIAQEDNLSLYQKYLQEAKKIEKVYFLGRLGDYKYYDMDDAIYRSIELFEEVFKITVS